jgi:hypothetical protein
MAPASFQNSRLSLPVGSAVFLDCNLIKSSKFQRLVDGVAVAAVCMYDASACWICKIIAKWSEGLTLTSICSLSTEGKHLRKAGSSFTSSPMPKRTLKPRIFTVGTMVVGLALVSAWKISHTGIGHVRKNRKIETRYWLDNLDDGVTDLQRVEFRLQVAKYA